MSAKFHDFTNNATMHQGIIPGSYTSTQTGTGRDFVAGDGLCAAIAAVGTVTGTNPTLDIKIQESADNSSFADISGATFTQITATGGAPVAINFQRTLRYLRVVGTIGGSATPTFPFNVTLIQQTKQVTT